MCALHGIVAPAIPSREQIHDLPAISGDSKPPYQARRLKLIKNPCDGAVVLIELCVGFTWVSPNDLMVASYSASERRTIGPPDIQCFHCGNIDFWEPSADCDLLAISAGGGRGAYAAGLLSIRRGVFSSEGASSVQKLKLCTTGGAVLFASRLNFL